eukprot:scaffold193077_cov21-Tisochrysis_lutea.AAC.1
MSHMSSLVRPDALSTRGMSCYKDATKLCTSMYWGPGLTFALSCSQSLQAGATSRYHKQVHMRSPARRYHKQVGDAQLEFLQDNGLHEEVLRMTPEELQEALEQQLKAERIEEEEESLRQNRSAQGALNPASIKSLVQSALEHTASKTEDLDVLKASLPRAPPKSGRRRRKPSIPMGPKAGANT